MNQHADEPAPPEWTPESAHGPQKLIGVALLVLAALLAFGAAQIPAEAGYAGVGPNFLPWIVSAALGICGALLLAQSLRSGGWHSVEQPSGAGRADWKSFAWVAAGILATAALMTTAGFVLANTIGYALAVRGLRQSEGRATPAARIVTDLLTGAAISAPVYWLFTKLLAINLPGLTGSGWI